MLRFFLLSENNFQGQIQLSGGALDFLKIVAELVSDFKELLNTCADIIITYTKCRYQSCTVKNIIYLLRQFLLFMPLKVREIMGLIDYDYIQTQIKIPPTTPT
jgi:hypothetical protein